MPEPDGKRIAFPATSRTPGHLPAFTAKVLEEISEGEHARSERLSPRNRRRSSWLDSATP
jgi:hypothetical protein